MTKRPTICLIETPSPAIALDRRIGARKNCVQNAASPRSAELRLNLRSLLHRPFRALSPTGLFTILLPLMRAGFVPFLNVQLGIAVSLLLLRIALPRLLRLFI